MARQCESLGIRALVALESYNSLCTNSKYFCSWDLSVYRDKNGGPLSQASDFWTSAPAYAAFQSYARQVVARWGASPAVFAWQMFNEMDGALGGVLPVATYWLGNITTYVASIDGHHHLITNSYAGESGLKQDDLLPHISFTTTHAYEGGDLAGTLAHYSAIKSTYGKPTYSGEFGRNASPRLTQLILHNGMWGTIAQLGAASGACWYDVWHTTWAGGSARWWMSFSFHVVATAAAGGGKACSLVRGWTSTPPLPRSWSRCPCTSTSGRC